MYWDHAIQLWNRLVQQPDHLATKSTVANTVDFVAGCGDKSATTRIRQLVAVDIVANSVNFVADTVDFVASVYRP